MAAKPIVVGTDGSGSSLRAVDWAAREAQSRDVPLRIVSVAPFVDWFSPAGQFTMAERKAAETVLADAVETVGLAASGVTVDTVLPTGEAAPVLAGLGRHACLLVVGSGDHAGGFTGMALASVSRYLAVHAPCPVVIDRAEPPSCGQVVVGVRDTGDSEAALGFAFEEASLRGAHLVAVQAWHWLPPPGTAPALNPAQVSAEALIRLYRLLESWQHKYPDVETGEEIVHAQPGQALTDLTATADLLVLGRHPYEPGATDAHLGQVTDTVLKNAHCPVAVVPAGG
jgi:nucleotide-binding universal stress UspA family protein